jgi:hypothetical protein
MQTKRRYLFVAITSAPGDSPHQTVANLLSERFPGTLCIVANDSLNDCADLALVFPVPLSARTFRLQEEKGSGLWDTVVGSDSLDSDLTC